MREFSRILIASIGLLANGGTSLYRVNPTMSIAGLIISACRRCIKKSTLPKLEIISIAVSQQFFDGLYQCVCQNLHIRSLSLTS